MPSQPFPRGFRRNAGPSVDWRALRTALARAAVAVGLATRAKSNAAVPPLLPGLNLQERIASRIADRVTPTPAPAREPAPVTPLSEAWATPAAAPRDGIAADRGMVARAAARL